MFLAVSPNMIRETVNSHSTYYEQTCPECSWKHSVILQNTQCGQKYGYSNMATAMQIMFKKEVPVWFGISGYSPDSPRTLEETLEDIILARSFAVSDSSQED